MARQSTRHKYRTRKEKNQRTRRTAIFIGIGIFIALSFFILRHWREYWAYLKTYFY